MSFIVDDSCSDGSEDYSPSKDEKGVATCKNNAIQRGSVAMPLEVETKNMPQKEIKLPVKRARTEKESKIPLSTNRYVSVREFREQKYVSIREFYKDKNGELKPSKKGIMLRIEEWEELLKASESINNDLGNN